jgi:hypothetical protein
MFTELPKQKRNRIVSKHFTNLGMWMPKLDLALLMWLLYWADKSGRIVYSTEMLDKFVLSAKYASEEYKHPPLCVNRQIARDEFRELVKMGLVQKIDRKHYQINKSLLG